VRTLNLHTTSNSPIEVCDNYFFIIRAYWFLSSYISIRSFATNCTA